MRGEDKASLLLVNCSILLICNKVICNKAARNLSSHGFNYFIKLKLKCVLIIAYISIIFVADTTSSVIKRASCDSEY